MAAALDGLMKREANIIAAARAGRDGRKHQGRYEGLDDVNEPCWSAIGSAPGCINAYKASGASFVSRSSGLILLFEEPRSVTGVRVVVGTIVTGGIAMRTFFSDTTKIDVI